MTRTTGVAEEDRRDPVISPGSRVVVDGVGPVRQLPLLPAPTHYVRRQPSPRPATAGHRPVILFGGLTARHESLLQAAIEGAGHRAEVLPCPDVASFQVGREHGNPGQCNPNHFTVGNLVRHLQQLEENGLSRPAICDDYVLVTAGACGPCRFGMYEAEYRLALHNAGFDDFRVVLLDKGRGLDQAVEDAGLEFSAELFLGLVTAVVLADLINDVAYQVRPFEVRPGQTDAVLEESLADVREVVRTATARRSDDAVARLVHLLPEGRARRYGPALARQLFGDDYLEALRRTHRRLDQVEVDRTRLLPVVKVIGEFWAQTTEGDGNYRMFRFLEEEGAQVVVEPASTWFGYLLHQARQRNADQVGARVRRPSAVPANAAQRLADRYRVAVANAPLRLTDALFGREYGRLSRALGGMPHPLADQLELERLAHPYYNSRASGGEGHLEVAKNLFYRNHGLAHLVISVKPFGCMPSTQSDGVQSALTSHFPDMLFLPVETSGEGEVNAHSRVQMVLAEARAKAQRELEQVLEQTGLTLDSLRERVADDPALARAGYRVPHTQGVAGTCANLALHLARRGPARRRGHR